MGRVALGMLLLLALAGGWYATAGARSGARSAGPVVVAPTGSDANDCSATAPCLSFDRAYRAARSGQAVEVAGGTYAGDQTVLYDETKTSRAHVVFAPAPHAKVTVDGGLVLGPDRLTRGASHVTFRDLTFTGNVVINGCGAASDSTPCRPDATAGGDDVTLTHLRVRGPAAFICAGCSHVTIRGGVWGPTSYRCRPGYGDAHPEVQNPYLHTKRSHFLVIDGATFQNFARCESTDHVECLQLEPADDVVIRNSTFRRCDTMTLAFANDLAYGSKSAAGYAAPNNVLVEGNFLDAAHDSLGWPTYYALSVRECTNCTFKDNVWLQAPRLPTGGVSVHNLFVGNLGPFSQRLCGAAGVSFARNVWAGAKCAPTDREVASLSQLRSIPAFRLVGARKTRS
jgi:hypothetical protein